MQGLVTTEMSNLDPAAAPFATNPRDLKGLAEGASIIEVVSSTEFVGGKPHLLQLVIYVYAVIVDPDVLQVKKVKPHVLLGLSRVGGVFNDEVINFSNTTLTMSQ